MITRKDYMDSASVDGGYGMHHAYYSQFVNDDVKDIVIKSISTPGEIRDMLSRDKHLNNIALNIWDRNAHKANARCDQSKFKEAGETASLSSGVCILKAAARMIAEGV